MRLLGNLKPGLRFLLLGSMIFLPRILSLQSYWSSDETLWLQRSHNFTLSLMQEGKELSKTNQSFHPGVTTMWLGGIGLWLKYQKALSTLPVHFPQLEGQSYLLSPATLVQSRLPITLITAFIVICVYFLLRKLLGTSVATIATIFIATDPFYLWQSRRLHTDALMTSFLLLSFLSLLLYLEYRPLRRYIAFSGICFGLACLSK